MKKIVTSIVFLVLTMGVFAQEVPNTIKVSGVHQYTVAPEYTVKMILSLNNVYYEYERMTFEEIKSNYLEKLEKAGIPANAIKEDALAYALVGYEKEGTILVYKTTSLEMVKKILSVKSIGVTKSDITSKAELSNEQTATYAKAAFEDAKNKAEAIAKKLGRNVGKAVSINDSNYKILNESLYYNAALNSKQYGVSVSFELL